MIIIFIRSVITFLILLVLMRLMGKRQIGEMQPFEFVITLLIAELACIPMADVSVPLVYGLAAMVAVFIIHQLFSNLEQLSRTTKRVISGKPSLVINKDGVDFYELKRNNMDVEDLIEAMRSQGYFSLDDLDYAIFESNGNLSAHEKATASEEPSSLPLLTVSEGKIVNKNLEIIKLSSEEIKKILSKRNTSLKKVGVMTIDGNGKVYLQEEGSKYCTFNISLPEGVSW